MVSGAFYIPKDNISKLVGDDAHFISVEKQTIAVADGVGGWTKKGVDELMMHADIAVDECEGGAEVDPKGVLQKAFFYTQSPGSSRARIITHSGGTLSTANVGDSGFMVFRGNKLLCRSRIQQHRRNRPYQLGRKNDNPGCASEMKVGVMAGDVVVLGSDGLLDNLPMSGMEEILGGYADAEAGHEEEKVEELAYQIAAKAYNKSLEVGGGKRDDITILVGLILMVPQPKRVIHIGT